MRKRIALVWVVTLITLGSGLVNLFSLMGRGLPERIALLRRIFPLEFLPLSRLLILLIGFALVISSINIHKRKRRAFETVFVLACLSVIFHLTKGLDYEEASLSLTLVVLLLVSRKLFTVKSSVPDLRSGLNRLLIALAIAIGYGVAGFWFLDKKEFGINFTIRESIIKTFRFLLLIGDQQIVPRTRHAHWFIDSLYLMTAATISYILFALFRPVIYQFRTLPREHEMAATIVEKYGHTSLEFFKLWPDKSYFFSTSKKSLIAYRVAGNFAMVLADPVGPKEEIEEVVDQFMKFCKENDWDYGFYQAEEDFLPIYKKLGLKKLKIGDTAIVDLTHFTLEGKEMRKFRQKIRQMEKAGISSHLYEPPISEEVFLKVKEVSDEWLQIPGRRERRFSLGMFEPGYIKSTPLFTALDQNGRVLAFVNIIPSYKKDEATIDLMRHRKDAPNGIMDYLFVKLFLYDRERGFKYFNLGMAPMAGFQEKEEATLEERAVHYFFQHMNFLFNYAGLQQFKAKYASSWEPRYAIYRNALDLPKLAIAMSKVSEI